MKITFIGTGNAFAPQRDCGTVLVNDSILLDAGPGLLVNLKRLALDARAIRTLFISHFHGDHFFGVPFLLLEYAFVSRTTSLLTIVGPPGVEDRIRAVAELAYPHLLTPDWPRPLRFIEAQPGITDTCDDLTYTPVQMAHGPTPAFGYRLYLPDGLLAYSGDTSMTDALFTLIEDARVIILEATSEETSSVHLGQQALRAVTARLPGDNVTFLTHLNVPGNAPWADLPVIVPHDLQTFQLDWQPGQQPLVTTG